MILGDREQAEIFISHDSDDQTKRYLLEHPRASSAARQSGAHGVQGTEVSTLLVVKPLLEALKGFFLTIY